MYRVNVIRNDNGQVTTSKTIPDLEVAMRYAMVVKRTNTSVARMHRRFVINCLIYECDGEDSPSKNLLYYTLPDGRLKAANGEGAR